MAVKFARLEPSARMEQLERLRAAADGLKNEIARSRAFAGVTIGYVRCGDFTSALSNTEQILAQREVNVASIIKDLVLQKRYDGLSRFVMLAAECPQTSWLLIEGLARAYPGESKLILEGTRRALEPGRSTTGPSDTRKVDDWGTLFGPEVENVKLSTVHNTKEEVDYMFSLDPTPDEDRANASL